MYKPKRIGVIVRRGDALPEIGIVLTSFGRSGRDMTSNNLLVVSPSSSLGQ